MLGQAKRRIDFNQKAKLEIDPIRGLGGEFFDVIISREVWIPLLEACA